MELISREKVENAICDKVTNEKAKELFFLFQDMTDICKKGGGIGLAAPQVGIYEKMFVWAEKEHDFEMVFNPFYIREGGYTGTTESCLTYGKEKYIVPKRIKRIRAVYEIFDGEKLIKKFKILNRIPAIIFQHETDHINGITIAMIGKLINNDKSLQ
jgi:peptide deformylase